MFMPVKGHSLGTTLPRRLSEHLQSELQILCSRGFVCTGFEESEFGLLQLVKKLRNSRKACAQEHSQGQACAASVGTQPGATLLSSWSAGGSPVHTAWEGAVAPGRT